MRLGRPSTRWSCSARSPSIANGLLAGFDQVPPLFERVGRVLGLSTMGRVRHVLLPGALPGYIAGLRRGWAFAWRSLMAAELITYSPSLVLGLGHCSAPAGTCSRWTW